MVVTVHVIGNCRSTRVNNNLIELILIVTLLEPVATQLP